MEVTILQLKQCWNTTINTKKTLRVRKLERSKSSLNLKFEFENFPLTIQLSQKMSRNFAPESPLSRGKFCSLFSISCLKSYHQIYSNISKAKPLWNCWTKTSCKRSFTSVPSAEQQSFYERSAQVSSLFSFSHSGRVRSPFGIRRIVIPRPHAKNRTRGRLP